MSAICRRRRNWIWIGRGDAGDDVKGKIYSKWKRKENSLYPPRRRRRLCRRSFCNPHENYSRITRGKREKGRKERERLDEIINIYF